MITWRVVVRGHLTDEADAALEAADIQHVSGHAGPGLESSSFLLRADDEADARAQIGPIADQHGLFVYTVAPFIIPVYTEVPSEEAAALEAASDAQSEYGIDVMISEPDGAGTVLFEIPATTVEAALDEARAA